MCLSGTESVIATVVDGSSELRKSFPRRTISLTSTKMNTNNNSELLHLKQLLQEVELEQFTDKIVEKLQVSQPMKTI